MTAPQKGKPAPAFKAKNQAGKDVTLEGFKGKHLVLYFYPKDDTPGCTTEAKDFTAMADAFAAEDALIVGVSKDSIDSHCKFIEKHQLHVDLLSDEDGSICEAYGVWVEKSMYGRTYMGIDRSTFLIDKDGVLREVWNKVKVPDHAKKVLETLRGLNHNAKGAIAS